MTNNNNVILNNDDVIEQITEEIATEETTEQTLNFEPITNFQADLKGAERLFWKGVKLINRYANITVNQWDKQDAISAIYIAVMTQEPTENDNELASISKAYFGIETREQFRAGYNALQKIVYQNRQQASKHEYNQEYGLDGTAAKDELQEIELDLTLQSLLTEQWNSFLELKLQGYSYEEIAEITGFTIDIVKKSFPKIKAILQQAFNVDTEGRKKGTRKR